MTELELLIKQKDVLLEQIQAILQKEVENAPHKDISIDDMTPGLWRGMTLEQRRAWRNWWRRQGKMSFSCITCGFPTVSGTMSCAACNPNIAREREQGEKRTTETTRDDS